MRRIYTDTSVWDAARERIAKTFAESDHVCVAFSGGKDSGVLLNLALSHAREHGITEKLSVFHLDYEAGYTQTIDYVQRAYEASQDVDWYWCALPVAAGFAASATSDHWIPWAPEQREIWVRQQPAWAVTAENSPFDFDPYGVRDYRFNVKFARWLKKQTAARTLAVLVGIRQSESLHRYAAIHNKQASWEGRNWATILKPGIVNVYPIHDWETEDVWTAYGREQWDYSRLYDLLHAAGVPLVNQRVASPFLDAGISSLGLYRAIDPEMWAKMVGRVHGANFASIYAGTKAVGRGQITLPLGHTWRSYAEFLLRTLPTQQRKRCIEMIRTSINYWRNGGAVSLETSEQLASDHTNEARILGPARRRVDYKTPHVDVAFDSYPDDLDVDDFYSVPTWKRVCIAILRNDLTFKTLGFGPTKTEIEKRRDSMRRFEEML